MKISTTWKAFLALGPLALAGSGWTWLPGVPAQSRLKGTEVVSYQVGEVIDPETFVLNRDLEEVRLLDLVEPETRLVVLVIFGGAYQKAPKDAKYRATIWCKDSFDDFSAQRALYHAFHKEGVRFIPVAVPPVYHAARFGYPEDVFLGEPEDSGRYRKAVRRFIELTEKEVESSIIPFPEVFYDPRFRLANNPKERQPDPALARVFPWQGKLKWAQDPRTYGTPTIWLLSPQGKVLREPFWGNDYDADPPEVYYGFAELQQAVRAFLKEEAASP